MSGDSAQLHWHKSQRSGATDCVEAAENDAGEILVRNSMDPDGGVLRFDRATWRAFLSDLKAGRFDLPDDPHRPSSGAPTVQ